ncbi:MAG TPA: helix-turn-helix domain-containing protein, partial [Bryobacteraceae bacterium]
MTLIERLKERKKPMTVKEVAEELGYHIMTIYDWTREGKIPFMRLGGRLKFDGPTLATWVEDRTLGA